MKTRISPNPVGHTIDDQRDWVACQRRPANGSAGHYGSGCPRSPPPASLTIAAAPETFPVVSRLSTLAALLLVALWLPATLHCQLESVGLEELFSCTGHASTDNDHDTRNQSDDCCDSFCQTVESGQFLFLKQRLTAAQPLAPVCLYQLSILTLSQSASVGERAWTRPDAAPPGQSTWQFARRAALPARAPSLNTNRA